MYKALLPAILLISLNISAQNISKPNAFFSSKKNFQDKIAWIFKDNAAGLKSDPRSRAVDTQADSIYFSYSFQGEEYSEPTRYYMTYEQIGGEKLPVEIIFVEGYEEDFNFRLTLDYNEQNQVIYSEVFFNVFNTNEKVGYIEQRFDAKGNLIFHYSKVEIPDLGEEIYGDSMAIVYNAENQETYIESYTIDYETGEWLITNIIRNMNYDSGDQLIAFEWDMYHYFNDTVDVSKLKFENLKWYGGYNYQFFSEILAEEIVLDEISPDSYLPMAFQGHLMGPIQVKTYQFVDGDWQYSGESMVDSISQNYLSILSTPSGGSPILIQLTLNEEGLIITEKFFDVGEDDELNFAGGTAYGYNQFGLIEFERQLFSEDGTVYQEDLSVIYEIDNENRLLFFESATSFQWREKGEYFYTESVGTDSHQLQNDAIKIFPNPVESKMTIQAQLDIIKPMQYQIISPDGRTMMAGTFEGNEQHEINVSNLPSGIYFFKWQMEDMYGCHKLIKL